MILQERKLYNLQCPKATNRPDDKHWELFWYFARRLANNDELSALFEFLDRCGPEVQGRGLGVLESQQVARIERFISGHCDETERRELAQFLQLHPAWIRWIADRVKMAREFEGSPVAAAK